MRRVFAVIIALNVCLVAALVGVLVWNALPRPSAGVFHAGEPLAAAAETVPVSGTAVAAAERGLTAQGVTVGGEDVGGLTPEKAAERLSRRFANLDDDIRIIFDADNAWLARMSDFGAAYDFDAAAAAALAAQKGAKLALPVAYDEALVAAKAAEIAELLAIAPTPPTMTRDADGFHTAAGAFGRAADADALARDIGRAITEGYGNGGGDVAVTTQPVAPAYGEERLAEAQDLLGTYQTKFNAGQTNRNQNIKTAAERIHNRVVQPGEVFSTNKEFGPTTYDNGYRMAGTYQGGKVVEGMGGGMCQVSTTLYVALLYAELEIVERTNHSMPVAYVDYAFDATLAGDYIDMKFRNDTEYPVLIETVITANTLAVNVYGHETRPAGRTLKFEKALVSQTQPPAEVVTYDPALPLDERVTDVSAKTGYRYELYKFAYQDGVLQGKTLVNTSNYRPVRGETRIGTGPAAVPSETVTAPEATSATPTEDVPIIIDPTEDEAPYMPEV